ncbi:apolipoprotein N-acyltransferase [Blattabacterium cuenoti]|uniref:apolipoprotein N-acyltransferase n=1 Tax=Blattabacterium cuenoti TaxID=1653831 RepID=UPI001EEBD4E2|nr:apolipoprotein N-acyltransferase [Blattabacterium cuenoti]
MNINPYFLYNYQIVFCSCLSGILLGLGWPTDGNPFYLFIGLIPILYVEHYLFHYSNYYYSQVFVFYFITFFIWNAISTSWLSNTQKPNGESAWIMTYLIPIILNSILMSSVLLLYSYIKKYFNNERICQVLLVCLWILFEKMHLEWDVSWPWLNLGNGFANYIKCIQWYEYTGILGGTVWIWIVNIGLFNSIIEFLCYRNKLCFYKKICYNISIIIFVIIISNFMYYNYYKIHKPQNKFTNVLILQPNIDPYHQKYNISTKTLIYNLKKLINQQLINYHNTNNNCTKNIYIIAPETTFPGHETKISIENIENNKILYSLRQLLHKYSYASFITGIELYSISANKHYNTSNPIILANNHNKIKWIDIFNSAIYIPSNLNKIQIHHKSKLVPAVETFPYKKFLFPILGKILLNFGGTVLEHSVEKNPIIFVDKQCGIKIASIICYESVFGEYVSKFFKTQNANFMVIITNDGWWGYSQGYKQHLSYARLRAIENRKFIARSANTGVSCLINERGDIIDCLPYGKQGALLNKIKINNQKTFYIKHGDFIATISLLTFIMIIVYSIIFKYFIIKYI